MGSRKLVIIMGPTYFSRLWCSMEIFVFIESGGSPSRVVLLPISGYHPKLDDFDFGRVQCSVQADMDAMKNVILIGCGSVQNFNTRVRKILVEIFELNGIQVEQRGGGGGGRRRSHTTTHTITPP